MAKAENEVTKDVQAVLAVMEIPNFKHWAGSFSAKGISDIIGTLPGTGTALFVEVKAGDNNASVAQIEFLNKHNEAGAVVSICYGPDQLVRELAEQGFAPAKQWVELDDSFDEEEGG